jgi:hypothetical protein
MQNSESAGRLRQWLPRIGVMASVLMLVMLLVAWMAYRHIPVWYQPAYVPYEDEQAARDELGAAFTELSRGMGQGVPFDFRVRQDELNRWLIARERIWPASKRWIPERITDPMIVYQDDKIIVAGTWCGPGPRTVINIHVCVDVVDGSPRAHVVSVRAGSLPIPLTPIKRMLARLEHDRAGRRQPLLPDGASVVDAIEGAPLPRDIPWSQPKGKFRIEALNVVFGELRARLRPVDRKPDRRPRGLL